MNGTELTPQLQELVNLSLAAGAFSFSPYSKFRAGAAIRTKNGKTYQGANIENRSYGLTICAERVAIFRAIMDGAKPGDIDSLAIASDNEDFASPCGACRQVLSEFAIDCPVVLCNNAGKTEYHTLAELLPLPFHAETLLKVQK